MPYCAFQPETVLPDLGNQIEYPYLRETYSPSFTVDILQILPSADFSIQSKEPTPSASMAIQKKLQERKYYLSGPGVE